MFISLFQSNTEIIYNRVDTILKENQIRKSEVPHDLKKKAVLLCLSNMMQQGWFSVCKTENVYRMLHVNMSREREKYYTAMHCIHWGDMDEKTKESLIAMIFDDIRIPMTQVECEVKDLTHELHG